MKFSKLWHGTGNGNLVQGIIKQILHGTQVRIHIQIFCTCLEVSKCLHTVITLYPEKGATLPLPQLCHMWTDFHNSFVDFQILRYITLWNINFRKTATTYITINDTPHGSVAMSFRQDFWTVGPLTITLLQIHCFVCLERIFKVSQHLQKLHVRVTKVTASSSCAQGHWPAESYDNRPQ